MQRAYDNVIHDVAIQDLPVVMCLDRGGIVGEDGVTHHGVFDMAAFGAVPGLTIAAPMDELELRNMMYTGLQYGHPFMIRYPRGNGAGRLWRGVPFEALPVGRGRRLREGTDVALVTVGTVGNAAARAAERAAEKGVSVAHYDLRFVKPLDEALLAEVGAKFRHVVTVEDGSLRGGVGEAVTAFFNARGCEVAVPDVEGQLAPLDTGQHGRGGDFGTQPRRLDVRDVHLRPYGRRAFWQSRSNGRHSGMLHKRHHRRRGKNPEVARPHRRGGICGRNRRPALRRQSFFQYNIHFA